MIAYSMAITRSVREPASIVKPLSGGSWLTPDTPTQIRLNGRLYLGVTNNLSLYCPHAADVCQSPMRLPVGM